MAASAVDIWSRLLQQVRSELPDQVIKTWLEPSRPLNLDGTTLYIGTPDQFAADWNESKYATILSNLTSSITGFPITIIFKVSEDQQKRDQMDLFASRPVSELSSPTTNTTNPRLAPVLVTRYTFNDFVIGKSNELAAAAAQAVAEALGRVYNPLFIYGHTGLGKTHLMHAIAHYVLEHRPNTRLAVIGTEQFTNQLVTAIQSRTTHEFKRRYREIDLLLIDDIQFLKGKEATQEEFFHTFNTLYEAGRQIVLTSDRQPSEITGLETRLVTRFEWGMVADIQPPNFEHRIAILRHKAIKEHLENTIPDIVIQFIAENIYTSIRELEGAIIKLLAYASLKHKPITVELAYEVFHDKLGKDIAQSYPNQIPRVTIATIQQAVATEWGVSPDGLKSKLRTRTLTVPRHVAMYIARQLLGLQLAEIGHEFGGRDHSTVIHSLQKIETDMKNDSMLHERINQIQKNLQHTNS